MEKGEGEAYFENGQKEGEENDELVDFYNVVVNEVSRCHALFHTSFTRLLFKVPISVAGVSFLL